MGRNTTFKVVLAVVLGFIFALLFRQCARRSTVTVAPPAPVVNTSTATLEVPAPPIIAPSVQPVPLKPVKKPAKPAAPTTMAPPPVKIFKELIPKNIEIVRVYYASMITGPSSSIQFDINGSGFTKEFEKMITVESGQPDAAVKNLALVTPNQIHGTLEINDKSATMVAFPRVLIGGKVVFQAPDPFAVIRPGEVLNFIFTEMGESGRTGRFRVFTNIDEKMFADFKVTVSTPSIQVTDLSPTYPFLVDGTITIGASVGGDYDVTVSIKDKTLWYKKGIVRVVRPNVGQTGLIQHVTANDGYLRPGDEARFEVIGSGFQREDVSVLRAKVKDLDPVSSSFTYASPGRLELAIGVPSTAAERAYDLSIVNGTDVLQDAPNAFTVVGKNWTRGLRLDPDLTPGSTSQLSLMGRDMETGFVAGLKVEFDEPELSIGSFSLANPRQATAIIKAGPNVKPGDYLLKITSDGKTVSPQSGSIIRVSANHP